MQRCHVLKDEDFKKLSWKPLIRSVSYDWYRNGKTVTDTRYGNFFTRAVYKVRSIPELLKNQSKAYQDLKSRIPLGSQNRANPSALKQEMSDTEAIENEMGRRSRKGRTSQNYKDMQTAVKNYREYQENMRQRLKDAAPDVMNLRNGKENLTDEQALAAMKGVISAEDLQEMQRLGKAVRDTAQKYLIGKGILPEKPGQAPKHALDDYSDYTKDRIEIAQTALRFGEKRSVLRDEEIELSARNERRVMESENRREGNIREKEQTQGPQLQA